MKTHPGTRLLSIILTLTIFVSLSFICLPPASAASAESEANNSTGSANPISVNQAVTGRLSSAQDIDYYTFTLSSPGNLQMNFRHAAVNYGDGKWVITLLRENGETWCSFVSYGDNVNASSYHLRLPAGIYYIKVESGWSGIRDINYQLTALFASEDATYEKQPNETVQDAYAIGINKTYTGNLESSSDIDYYKFNLVAPGNLQITLRHEAKNYGDGKWLVTLLKENGETWYSFTSYGENASISSFHLRPPAGIYYIKVESGWSNICDIDYQLSTRFSSENDLFEKESNDTLQTACLINVNQAYTGNLESSNDVDYYLFDVAANSQVQLRLQHESKNYGDGKWEVSLLDPNEGTLSSLTSYGENARAETSVVNLPTGVYYVKVTSGWSNIADIDYTLTVISDHDSLWNNWTGSNTVNVSTDKTWTISFSREVNTASINSANIYVATDPAGLNKVSYAIPHAAPGNGSQVIVAPPPEGWMPGTTYYLFISKSLQAKASNQMLPKGIRMKFSVAE